MHWKRCKTLVLYFAKRYVLCKLWNELFKAMQQETLILSWWKFLSFLKTMFSRTPSLCGHSFTLTDFCLRGRELLSVGSETVCGYKFLDIWSIWICFGGLLAFEMNKFVKRLVDKIVLAPGNSNKLNCADNLNFASPRAHLTENYS